MTNVTIKDYIRRAKELEVAVYKQKKLMDEHEKMLLANCPSAPTKNIIEIPMASNLQEPQKGKLGGQWWFMLVVSILGILMAIVSQDDMSGFMLVSGIIFLALFAFAYSQWNSEYDKALAEYHQQISELNNNIKHAQRRAEREEKRYNSILADYNERIAVYEEQRATAMIPHKESLKKLEDALQSHYETNVLFAKYRNLVAVATIDEYLQSGRCETLEGSNGAYNLYEMELRQNIVIGQLSMILDNMEQIRSNQYTLYQELSMANMAIADILTEIREMHSVAKLNAYFASVSAMVDASPKYIHGHIY